MNRAKIGKAAMLVVAGVLAVAACSSSGSSNNTLAPPSAATTPTPAATTPPAAPSQTVTITPHTGLTDGQMVKVVGKGYKPGKQYGVTECANKGAATTGNDCNLRGIKVAIANDSGVVTVSNYPVAKTFNRPAVNCARSPFCIVSVANAGVAMPTEVGAADIRFAS
jgi:hypothetical protein